MTKMVRGVRGAITVEEDRADYIHSATERLLREMMLFNQIDPKEVASVWITVTEDLTSSFPARALRNLEGWSLVPVMCAREIPVQDSLPRCIRVMIHLNTELRQDEIHHVYLEKAKQLRPDLHLTHKHS